MLLSLPKEIEKFMQNTLYEVFYCSDVAVFGMSK